MRCLFLVFIFLISTTISAFESENLRSNKEVYSRLLSRKNIKHISYWINNHSLNEVELYNASKLALKRTIELLNKVDLWCEINFLETLISEAKQEKVIEDENEVSQYLNYLRYKKLIDDLLLNILQKTTLLKNEFKSIDQNISNNKYDLDSNADLEKIYQEFNSWPDEKEECLLEKYETFSENVFNNFKRNDLKFISKLNFRALKSGIIDQTTYQKLEAMKYQDVLNWDLYLNKYIKIIKTVKDKLTERPEESSDIEFSETYIYRSSELTRRGRLYSEFSNNQILLMSQLIEKTAKRIDAKEVHLYFQYDDNQSNNEVYIFSPMEQYRIAIKLLRKDFAELKRSETFKGMEVKYEDIIAAAFETGIITSKELNYVLTFDDLWNPKVSRWRSIANLSLNLAGTATFLLPNPFNYISAIALIFTQSSISGREQSNNPEDNENVII